MDDDYRFDDPVFNPVFENEEPDVDFDPVVDAIQAQEEEDAGYYWLSELQEIEMRLKPAQCPCPKATDWRDVPEDELEDMDVSIDRARKHVFDQGKTEIIDILKQGWGETTPSFNDIAEKNCGKRSKLYHVFQTALIKIRNHHLCNLLLNPSINYCCYCFFVVCKQQQTK